MIRRNSVKPCRKLRVKSKPADTLERQKKHFLGCLGRLIRIAQHSQREVVNGPLPPQNKPIKGHRITALAGGNPGSFLRTLSVLSSEGSCVRQGQNPKYFPSVENAPQGRSPCLYTPFRQRVAENSRKILSSVDCHLVWPLPGSSPSGDCIPPAQWLEARAVSLVCLAACSMRVHKPKRIPVLRLKPTSFG